MTRQLYKTTIIIWSEYNGQEVELEDLAREAQSGDAYCSVSKSELIEKPENDADWDNTTFFEDGFSEENSNGEEFLCEWCSFRTPSEESIEEHEKILHAKELLEQKDKYSSNDNPAQHLKEFGHELFGTDCVNDKGYRGTTCSFCDVKETDVPDLLQHELKHHGPEISAQHFEEYGHVLDSPECDAHNKQRSEKEEV